MTARLTTMKPLYALLILLNQLGFQLPGSCLAAELLEVASKIQEKADSPIETNELEEGNGNVDSPARLVIEQGKIDLGQHLPHESVPFEFKLRNDGGTELEIKAVAHCGCTVLDPPPEIAPGESEEVTGRITFGNSGDLHKTIHLKTNDPLAPLVLLSIHGEAVPAVRALNLRRSVVLNRDRDTNVEIELEARRSDSVSIVSVHCNADFVQACVEPIVSANSLAADSAPRNYRLQLTIGPEAPHGRSELSIFVETSCPREQQVRIRLACEKGIVVLPPSVRLGPTSFGGKQDQATFVVRNAEGDLQLKEMPSSASDIQVETTSVRAGIYLVKVKYTGEDVKLLEPCTITLLTNDPEQPRLELSVEPSGRVRQEVLHEVGPLP